MQSGETQWSSAEREIAKGALETARKRETDTLVQAVRQKAGEISNIEDIWCLHDFLSARRHYIDGKYDDRESQVIFVLSQLVKEGWLAMDELEGLNPTKLAKIIALLRVL